MQNEAHLQSWSEPFICEGKINSLDLYLAAIIIEKTELGTKEARSQLCINLVLRY